MVSERAEGPQRTDVECRSIKTFLLEPRVLPEEETMNEVDEAVLEECGNWDSKGGTGKF